MGTANNVNRNNSKLFFGVFSVLSNEFENQFDLDDLLGATDVFIKVHDGSVSKRIIKDQNPVSTFYSRNTYGVITNNPWSVSREIFHDDCDEGFKSYEASDRLNNLLNH